MALVHRNFVAAALLLSVLCAVPAFAAEEIEDRFCTVRGVVGNVQVRFAPNYKKVRREMAVSRPIVAGVPTDVSPSITDEWTPLRLNMVVGERCEIRSGPESEVRLETIEGSMIKIGENTETEIMALNVAKKTAKGKQEAVANTRLRVTGGNIVATIKRALAGETSNVRFDTPTSTAAIRGTTIEIEVQGSANTVIRAFDGTVEVAPIGSDRFVALADGKMAEIGQGQRVVVVKDVPKTYKRRAVYLKGEAPPQQEGKSGAAKDNAQLAMAGTDTKKAAEEKTSAAGKDAKADAADTEAKAAVKDAAQAKTAMDSVTIALGLSLGSEADTIKCVAGSTITVEGVVSPKSAAVSVSGVMVKPDATGIFRRTWSAPLEPGVFTLTISAESEGQIKAITRTIRVTGKK